jgi:hypothetical protein
MPTHSSYNTRVGRNTYMLLLVWPYPYYHNDTRSQHPVVQSKEGLLSYSDLTPYRRELLCFRNNGCWLIYY